MDCPREAMQLGVRALRLSKGWTFEQEPLLFLRTCDKGLPQTHVLMKASKTLHGGQCCHFGDMLERLPAMARQHIAAGMPASSASKQEQIDAYADIHRWLDKNRSWIFPSGATSFCSIHREECPVMAYPGLKKRKHNEVEEHGDSDEAPVLKALKVTVAGVTCHGWSNQGGQEQFAHVSEATHAIWSTERKASFERADEDIVFCECTPRYKVKDKFADAFGSLADCRHIVDGPELHGWPHKRQRCLAVALNKSKVKWVGPEDHASDFADRFHRACVMRGADLFTATDSERYERYCSMAAGRKFKLTMQDMGRVSKDDLLEMILPPGGIERLREWQEWRGNNFSGDEKVVCDLDHHPASKCTGGTDWPVQLTHGTVVLIGSGKDDWKMATGLEHLGALGLHVHSTVDTSLFGRSPLVDILSKLEARQQKLLAGNGMHLLTQCAWMLYCFSNIARVDRVEIIPRVLAGSSCELEEDSCRDDANDERVE
jgi:hypothetical protein